MVFHGFFMVFHSFSSAHPLNSSFLVDFLRSRRRADRPWPAATAGAPHGRRDVEGEDVLARNDGGVPGDFEPSHGDVDGISEFSGHHNRVKLNCQWGCMTNTKQFRYRYI